MSRACKSCCRREQGNLPSSQLHKHSSKALPNPGWPPAAGIRGCGVTATGQHQPLLWAELWGEQSAQILRAGSIAQPALPKSGAGKLVHPMAMQVLGPKTPE